MLKAIYKPRPNLHFEIEAKEQRDIFHQVALIEEVFGELKCGLCGKENLSFRVRTVEENDYYEMVCKDCGAKLGYGQNKKGGTLFPHRKLKNGLPARPEDQAPFDDWKLRGWHKYDKNKAQAQANTKKK